jgi:uncharacterized protein (TIGR02118 family)
MVKISIRYPHKQGSRFDMDYYLNVHMPMSIERLSAADGFRGVTVAHGVSVGLPELEPVIIASCDYLFDSFEDFLAAFQPHAEVLQGDIANYTDVEPAIQVDEVKIFKSGD